MSNYLYLVQQYTYNIYVKDKLFACSLDGGIIMHWFNKKKPNSFHKQKQSPYVQPTEKKKLYCTLDFIPCPTNFMSLGCWGIFSWFFF